MKVDRWKQFARTPFFVVSVWWPLGLGEIVGEVAGRQIKISSLTKNTRNFERMSVAGTRVDILLHDTMNPLYFQLVSQQTNFPLLEPLRWRSEMKTSIRC